MGVPGFNSWFALHHRHAYVSCVNRSWDHVYIDMASILHSAMKKASDLPHFRRILFKRLDSVMAIASPKKSVMFALDGPAPLAKLLTQRNRRAKETSKSFESLPAATGSSAIQGKDKSAAAQVKPRGLSTVGLTPGTPLMAEVERNLEFYICQRLQKWQHLEFELSGARVQGEGEHKIMKRINAAAGKGSHVIVGNDADIILMSLMSPVKQLFILSQQTSGRGSRFSCISFDALNMLRSSDVMKLSLTPNTPFCLQNRAAKLAGLDIDLVLISMLAKGNDYLPAVRGIGGAANSLALWKAYLRLRLAPRWLEQNLVVVKRETQTATLNVDMLVALLKSSPGSSRNLPTPANLLPADAKHYAQGLVWVLNMFLQAECPDYRWTHDNEPPSMQQLIKGLQDLNLSPQPSTSNKKRKTGPMLPPVCALSLIPRAGQEHMPEAMRRLMDKGSPVADVFENCSICDRLTAENAKVAVEYMHLHAAIQARIGRNARSAKQGNKPKANTKAAQVTPSSNKLKATAAQDSVTPASFDVTTSESDDADALDPEVEDVLDPGDSEDEDLGEEEMSESKNLSVDQMQSKANHLKGRMNKLRTEREAHLDSAHPYAPFPIDRIEQAVASIRPETLSPQQQELCSFGQSHTFTWMTSKKLAATSSKAFRPKVPPGLSPGSPVLNVVRKPIIEQAQPARAQKVVASHDQVLLHAYLHQHKQQQKRPRFAPQAVPAKLWPLPRLQLPSQLASLCSQKGFIRPAPLQRSMLTRNIMPHLC